MEIRNKIEQHLSEIKELEKFFREAQSKEILPLSFFSSSIDILNRLRAGIYEIEAAQLELMQEHLGNRERGETAEVKELELTEESSVPEEKHGTSGGILADTIGRKINTDFGKSLSLNERFMFQRDLFQGDANKMNQAFATLNAFQSSEEVMTFLNGHYAIHWNTEAGIAFKELLDKRFV